MKTYHKEQIRQKQNIFKFDILDKNLLNKQGKIQRMTTQKMQQALHYMKSSCARKNKKGIAFIFASNFIWRGILIIHTLPIDIKDKKSIYMSYCGIPNVIGIGHYKMTKD
ncbi:MAG: hypothetical protein IJX07_01375 [Bacillales bacterium]|nr:hypothetical protein [Bacillales bacterium]